MLSTRVLRAACGVFRQYVFVAVLLSCGRRFLLSGGEKQTRSFKKPQKSTMLALFIGTDLLEVRRRKKGLLRLPKRHLKSILRTGMHRTGFYILLLAVIVLLLA